MTPGYGSSFRMQLDGEWMAYNQATGEELDMLELSTAPMPAQQFCTRGRHRSDGFAREADAARMSTPMPSHAATATDSATDSVDVD